MNLTWRRLGIVVAAAALAACGTTHQINIGKGGSVQRYGMVIGLKPEKMAEYKRLHADPWPDVLAMIRECNIRNYSIYLTELEPGKFYLFGYFEYTGSDFDADMKKMAADSTTQRWWKETDPCQYPIATAKPGEKWSTAEEVFHME